MSRDWWLYLEDMALCCSKVLAYTHGLELSGLLANTMVYDAVIRNLEILGEAAKNIPDEVRGSIHRSNGARLPACVMSWPISTLG